MPYKDPEKARQARLAWIERNPEKNAASKAAWVARNPAKRRAVSLASAKRNMYKHRAQRTATENSRRARQLKATPAWVNQDAIDGMYEVAGLFRRIGIDMEVDHVVPLQSRVVCGFHVADNLQLLVASSNASKGNRWWPDKPEEI